MKKIKFPEYKEAVGQSYITLKAHNFPVRGWAEKTIGNIIYIWAKYEVEQKKISGIEKSTGKKVKFSIVPKSIIEHVGI